MSDLQYMSAIEMAAAIREKSLSSAEALEGLLARIGERDGPLNIVVTLDEERARADAEAADEETARGESRGPLHGVPMTIKDSFCTKGVRTTSGAPELSDHIAENDAVPVARLRGAGAVIFAKTNLPIYAGDVQSYNEVFGTSNNPWNVEYAVGGSSGGSGAALAAGFTPLELGSDIGGSIRNPAHCNGVMGHKSSFRLVPALGQIPGPPGTLTQADIAVAGPMARTVDDLELGLDVMAGPDDWEGVGYKLDLPTARGKALSDFKVAAWIDDDFCPLASEVSTLLNRAVDEVERAGAAVDRHARPDFEFAYANGVFSQLIGAAMCGGYSLKDIEKLAADIESGNTITGAENAVLRHRAWLSANERRLQMRRKWFEFFKSYDVVLMPVSPTTAIPHDHSEPQWGRKIKIDGAERDYGEQIRWMGLTGVSYLPATVVPVGVTRAGLPVGIQIAGPYLEDRTTLAVARGLADRMGGFQPPPGF
ncbi:MAG: amidase [Acidobacteriota bacterium]|nr:amidase [Acidobacteriota bacterium]